MSQPNPHETGVSQSYTATPPLIVANAEKPHVALAAFIGQELEAEGFFAVRGGQPGVIWVFAKGVGDCPPPMTRLKVTVEDM